MGDSSVRAAMSLEEDATEAGAGGVSLKILAAQYAEPGEDEDVDGGMGSRTLSLETDVLMKKMQTVPLHIRLGIEPSLCVSFVSLGGRLEFFLHGFG